MNRRKIIYGLLIALIPLALHGQAIDTAAELRKMIDAFKTFRNMGYSYTMDAVFPNGEKDQMIGNVYMNNEGRLYFNECNAFTMIYSAKWFYKADHRNKVLTIVNMDKEYDQKQKKTLEKDIFQNGAVITFLDSVLLKTAKVKYLHRACDSIQLSLGFPKTAVVQKLDLIYDAKTNSLVKYDMTVVYPLQKTAKGIQVITTSIRCSNFIKADDKKNYDEHNYFVYDQGKLQVKKYKGYKLLKKM